MTITVTKYAIENIRKRFKIKKRGVQSFAEKAFEQGIKKRIAQNELKKYMDLRGDGDYSFCKLYYNGIFVFKNIRIHEVLLVTCCPLPGRFNNYYKLANDKRKLDKM